LLHPAYEILAHQFILLRIMYTQALQQTFPFRATTLLVHCT